MKPISNLTQTRTTKPPQSHSWIQPGIKPTSSMPPLSPNHPTTPVSNTTTEFEFPLLFSLPHRTRSSHEDDLGIDYGKRGVEREGTEMERVIRKREKDGYRSDLEQWLV
ncbi:hypothetical protein Droror1_Dr00003811 [Drosera rotundifolia]